VELSFPDAAKFHEDLRLENGFEQELERAKKFDFELLTSFYF